MDQLAAQAGEAEAGHGQVQAQQVAPGPAGGGRPLPDGAQEASGKRLGTAWAAVVPRSMPTSVSAFMVDSIRLVQLTG
jgi:hypothetical protein